MTRVLRRWCVTALVLTGTAWATIAPAATAATARQTIAKLNAQRTANGIPAGLTEDPALSAACAKHDHYMALNNMLTHVEDPNNPGYTAEGASAGANAVLTQGSNWDTGNPYEYAPLHLDQLLAPRLLTLGSADAFGFSCTTTFPGWTRPDPSAMTVYTYPGNGGRVSSSEVARELPWTPGDLVGLAQPSRTGPTLFVLVDAPNERPENNPATLSDATVSGPTGPVAIKTVDGNTALPNGSQYPTLAPYISPGGFIIPVRPLIPGTAYHAHVVVTLDKLQKVYDWSFTSLASDPHSSLTAKGGRLLFSSASHQPIRVTFRRIGGGRSAPVTIRPGRSLRLTLAPGSWQVCGHQPAGDRVRGLRPVPHRHRHRRAGTPARPAEARPPHGQARRPLQPDPPRSQSDRDDHRHLAAVPERHLRAGERHRAHPHRHPPRPPGDVEPAVAGARPRLPGRVAHRRLPIPRRRVGSRPCRRDVHPALTTP